jgi:ethanolamine permease
LPNGWQGIFAAIPFAIWFFLAIEGVANVAEEAIKPQRTILIGFGSAILTLVILCILTFTSSVGVAGWEAIVYKADGTQSDSPLPLALGHITGSNNLLYHLLITVGLFGLVASFHGIILAAGRSTFEFGRVRYAPAFLGNIHKKFRTPANALLINMGIGIIALLTGHTAEIITISVFGALTLYIISMISLLRLRKKEPNLERPFKVPAYPLFPWTALIIATVSLVAMTIYNQKLALIYFLLIGASYLGFKLFTKK